MFVHPTGFSRLESDKGEWLSAQVESSLSEEGDHEDPVARLREGVATYFRPGG